MSLKTKFKMAREAQSPSRIESSVDHRLYKAIRSIQRTENKFLARYPDLEKTEVVYCDERTKDTRHFDFRKVLFKELAEQGWPRNIETPTFYRESDSDDETSLMSFTTFVSNADNEYDFRNALDTGKLRKEMTDYTRAHVGELEKIALKLRSFKIEDIEPCHYSQHHIGYFSFSDMVNRYAGATAPALS